MGETKTKKEQLIERFDFARKQGLDLIEEINQYAKDNNCFETHFMQGYTFKNGLELLIQERDLIFSNDNRNTVLDATENSNELDFLIEKIEEQINHHGEIKFGLNIYFKSLN
jgi:hypothetical protein